jgi:predicted ATPase
VGRESELDDLAAALGRHRLVTVAGTGGIGKTRLASRLAASDVAHRPDGVFFVPLAGIAAPDLTAHAVARGLGIQATDESADGQVPILEVIHRFVAERDMLLVLDNCEDAISHAAEVAATLVGAGPSVRVLATSRQPLGVPGEAVYRLGPLPVPPDGAGDGALERYEAVQLFLQRAAEARGGRVLDPAHHRSVATVVRALDGVPLAVELAAAWVRISTPAEIERYLEDNYETITRDPGGAARGRHWSLTDVVAASYAMLADEDRALFRRLALFTGGFDAAASAAVTGSDVGRVLAGLARLSDRSLILSTQHDCVSRLRMLEPVRRFALARLKEAGEYEDTVARFVRWSLELAEELDGRIRGPACRSVSERADLESSNFGTALRLAVDGGMHAEALRLVAALGWFWYVRSRWTEALRWFDEVLDRTATTPSRERARAAVMSVQASGTFTAIVARLDRSRDALAMAEATGDELAEVVAHLQLAIGLGWAGVSLDEAERHIVAAGDLAAETADEWVQAWVQKFGGLLALRTGDVVGAVREQEEALRRLRAVGDEFAIGHSLIFLGHTARLLGDDVRAREAFVEGAAHCDAVGAWATASHALLGLAWAEIDQGDLDRAERVFRDAVARMEAIGDVGCAGVSLRGLAVVARGRGDLVRSERLAAQAFETATRLGHGADAAAATIELAATSLAAGDPSGARSLLARRAADVGGSGIPLDARTRALAEETAAEVARLLR